MCTSPASSASGGARCTLASMCSSTRRSAAPGRPPVATRGAAVDTSWSMAILGIGMRGIARVFQAALATAADHGERRELGARQRRSDIALQEIHDGLGERIALVARHHVGGAAHVDHLGAGNLTEELL